MSGLSGYGLLVDSTVEVVAAYAAAAQNVPAVEEEPGWYQIGAFYLPKTVPARLEVIACVSDASLVGYCRLYDVEDGEPVAASVVRFTTLAVGQRAFSSPCELTGNRVYLMQMQVVGDVGEEFFGFLQTASLAGV